MLPKTYPPFCYFNITTRGKATSEKHGLDVLIKKAGVVCMPVACEKQNFDWEDPSPPHHHHSSLDPAAAAAIDWNDQFHALWCKLHKGGSDGSCPLQKDTIKMKCGEDKINMAIAVMLLILCVGFIPFCFAYRFAVLFAVDPKYGCCKKKKARGRRREFHQL
jgi:hypothetical protein